MDGMQGVNETAVEILKQPIRLKIFGKDRFVPLIVILMVIGLAVTALLMRHMLLRDKWHTLNVEWHGYALDYPALWSTQTYAASGGRGENLDYLSARISSTGPYVFIHQTEMEHPDLTDAFEWGQEVVRGRGASNISSPVETQIGRGGYLALRQSYDDGSKLIKAFFVASENRMYMIEFIRVSEDSQPIIDRMLASFRLYDGEND